MADLKENIDNEVAAAKEEFLKLNSHIEGYMNEMEKMI
jgi:kinetochore protein Nuf2